MIQAAVLMLTDNNHRTSTAVAPAAPAAAPAAGEHRTERSYPVEQELWL